MAKDDLNHTALVTGGTRGIGLAIVRALAASGLEVWTCGTGDESCERARTAGANCLTVEFREPREAVAALLNALPDVDILVNNAGIGTAASIAESTPELIESMFRINLITPMLLMRAYLPGMVARGFGRVVNISSISGMIGNTDRFAYAASKHGLIGASRCASDEHAADGITINTVCPGPTDTDMLRELAERSPGFIDKVRAKLKIGRLVAPDEVARLVTFLIEPTGAAITGQCYVIDGGIIQS